MDWSLEELREALIAARFEPRPPVVRWVQAQDATKRAGTMAMGSKVGVRDDGALGDVVVCASRPKIVGPFRDYAEYRMAIPHKGRWTLWARVRYPTGGDMSFGFARVGEKVTLRGPQVIGNCGRNGRKWHWTGRGGGITTVPPGTPIRLDLPKGEFVFRVYPREGPGTAKANPRLDVLCLSDDPDYAPSDADARKALAARKGP